MAGLAEVYFKADVLRAMVKKVGKGKGLSIVVAMNDETNQYGQNVSAYLQQSKEEREAKTKKIYVGNGKVFWLNDEGVVVAERQEPSEEDASDAGFPTTEEGGSDVDLDDLPF